ncbi:hypothetical protein PsYK624_074070 [Phanerochaete sordida]|uniref:Uncharacterized protein n=1 Tax=Phanerochaete sordida TaxID=48140 RepID=A0A9P3LE91_9APHY|nr:hypothetical protein PsYK624_074070 [Phanerochaete sordida]
MLIESNASAWHHASPSPSQRCLRKRIDLRQKLGHEQLAGSLSSSPAPDAERRVHARRNLELGTLRVVGG